HVVALALLARRGHDLLVAHFQFPPVFRLLQAAAASSGAASVRDIWIRPASQWRASSWLGPIHSAVSSAGARPRNSPARTRGAVQLCTPAKNRRLSSRGRRWVLATARGSR